MPSGKTLRVLANPWHHLDHEGMPAGACACDPNEHNPNRAFVGAKLSAEETRKAMPEKGITARHRVTFEFSEEAQELPNTEYYRRAVNSGELIAADAETAKLCGFKRDGFSDPKALLAAEREKAATQFYANYGEWPPFFGAAEQKAMAAKAKAKTEPDAQKGGDK